MKREYWPVVFGVLGLVFFGSWMQFYGGMLQTHIDIFQSQLSFDPLFLHEYYSIMVNTGEITAYIMIQWLDYGFMLSYGLLGWGLTSWILFQKILPLNSRGLKYISKIRWMALIGPSLDAIENVWLLKMLMTPLNFPDFWAISYSSFALIKWILEGIVFSYCIVVIAMICKKKFNPIL